MSAVTAPATPATAPASSSALVVKDLRVRFGGLVAVDVGFLSVDKSEIVGIIGPNGAGKTTLFDAISGMVAPEAGSVFLNGRDVTYWTTEARSDHGLGRSFQNAELFGALTVFETLALAHEREVKRVGILGSSLGAPWARRGERRVEAQVERLVSSTGLDAYADKFIMELSTGTRRVVDLTCSLARRPEVLLLDEPSSGIAQREVEELESFLRKVKESIGCTMVIIEHDIPLVAGLADRMYALETGKVIAVGLPDDVLASPRVISSYLGTDPSTIQRSGVLAAAPKKKPSKVVARRAAPKNPKKSRARKEQK